MEEKILEELRQKIIDNDKRRADWEKNMALFEPLRKKLERGRSVLELGDDFNNLKALRAGREQHKLDQINLRESIMTAKAEAQSAEESFALAESALRDKLAAQTKLIELANKAQELDKNLIERQDEAERIRANLNEVEINFKERAALVSGATLDVEKLTIALRESRKYLQANYSDESLINTLPGIKKCFELFNHAQDKLNNANLAYENAIKRKQKAQSALNDRQVMFADVEHRFNIVEKNYEQARALFESALKGKSISDWQRECERLSNKIEQLEELAKQFINERELQIKLKNLQEDRLRLQQESRSLNLKDIEQSGKLSGLEAEVKKLEKRVALLQKIEDLDLIRELLDDGEPCPLCGAMTHPYLSGAMIPDSQETRRQLEESQNKLKDLQDALSIRKSRLDILSGEINSAGESEKELRRELNILTENITLIAPALGLKFGAGVPPLEELDRVWQRTRDSLQMAKNNLDAAEAAQRNFKNAEYELEKTRENKSELTRFHQEALFNLQGEKTDERHLEEEARSCEEAFNSIRRELVSQLTAYGYKNLPDENPGKIIEALNKRSEDWQSMSKLKDKQERELNAAQNLLNNIKKDLETLKLSRNDIKDRLRAVEAECGSINQQRLVLFESKKPSEEKERMEREVIELKRQLETRRVLKNESLEKFNNYLEDMHKLETEMALERESIQKAEIAFGKKLLAAGFKNEDDFVSSSLNADERQELQKRLKDLTQEDLDLNSEREELMAQQIEIQGRV
ncbi:MAG: hypothetical protein IJP88_09030 [Synergistaceae bacterium]|nr:hypothetical protein [Synergistaceae bacterium]